MGSEPAAVRVAAIGEFPLEFARDLVEQLSRRVDLPCRLDLEPLPIEIPMLAGRGQADADRLLERIEARSAARGNGEVLVGLTLADIGHPIFTHFFGRARHHGDGLLVSTARLTPTFYGMTEDPQLLRTRTVLEILHELGHVVGLPHCRDAACLMHFAPSVEEIDTRGDSFCPDCLALVEPHLHPHQGR